METETVITLAIASTGVLLGAASLGWQAATYVLTGGRAKATLKVGGLHVSGTGVALVSADKATTDTLRQAASQGFNRPVIAVEVRSVGRMAVTVSRLSIRSNIGMEAVPLAASMGPSLPHRLDTGESATWMMDLAVAMQLRDVTAKLKDGERPTIVGVVELGDGRSYTTPERFG